MIKEKTLAEAKQAIFDFDAEKAVNIVQKVVSTQDNPLELMDNAFIPALNEIGEMFSSGRMFLPELIPAAEVMKAVTGIISDSLPKGAQSMEKGTVVMGTVQGDIHDIGKTLVVTLMGVNGYTIHDLGRDVSNETFIEKAVEVNADIIGTSSLLVGGAPVTQRWANRIGADAYAENAHEAVVKANDLLGK